jgi:tetratricopeptide (TPR) repeat protein
MSEETKQALQAGPAVRDVFSYDGFISYRHSPNQAQIVGAIQAALHKFAKPFWKLRALHLYRDESNLSVHPDLWGTLVEALDRCRYLLLVASPEAVESKWVKRETSHWLEHRGDRNLIILLTDGEVVWDDAAQRFDPSRTTAIPGPLLTYQKTEPLYVDLRWAGEPDAKLAMSNPHFADAVATIAAELHGKSKDELAGIDVQEHRRWRWLRNAGFTAILLLAVGMAIAAYYSYEERNKAEQSLATTNSVLTNFFEVVSEDVAPTAPVTTVESLVQHVQQAIERLPADNSAQLTTQRARMFIILAELKFEQGDVPGTYQNSIKAHKLLASLNPTVDHNPEALHLLARSNTLIARFLDTSVPANFSQPLDSDKDALGQLQKLEKYLDKSEHIGDGWRWLRSLALLRQDLGDFLLSKLAKIDEADESFRLSRESFQKLKLMRPVDVDIDFNLAWAANKSGDILYQQGKTDAALDQFETARDGIIALGEPYLWAKLERRKALSVVHGNIGLALRRQGKFGEAIEAFRKSENEVDRLLQRDRQRVWWLETWAWTHDVVGETKIMWARTEQNQALLEGARPELERAKVTRDELALKSTQDARFARLAGEPQITEANIAYLEGTMKEFSGDFRGAAVDFLTAAHVNPSLDDERQEEMILRRVTFLKLAGSDYLKVGRPADGRKQLEEAWDIANRQIAKAVYPEAFSVICSELKTLLDSSQP